MSGRFELGWYNGWSPAERRATLPIQRDAIRSGAISRPSRCSICSSSHDVWLHDERYDRPLEAYHVCRPCHRILHARFEQPQPWRALVSTYATGASWFEALCLDPASQWRPFAETYPQGMPHDRATLHFPLAPSGAGFDAVPNCSDLIRA